MFIISFKQQGVNQNLLDLPVPTLRFYSKKMIDSLFLAISKHAVGDSKYYAQYMTGFLWLADSLLLWIETIQQENRH